MATVTTQDSRHESAAPASSGTWAFDFAALSILAALAYRLPTYVISVNAKEHLQFALLIPVGVAFLAHLRNEGSRTDSTRIHGATPVTALILLAAAVLCFDSFLSYSAVSWAISAMLTSLAFVHFWGGWALFQRVWPLWAFAWLMVPPPFGLDMRLITELQLWVSWLASYTLDTFHVAHVLEGNKINLEGKELFVAEACSGINSLFATFVVLVFAMLVFKRNWLHIALLFALGFLCVLVVNVFRVVTLTSLHYFWPKVGDFFDQGVPHFTFGLFCFALLILLIVSVDALLGATVSFLFAASSRSQRQREAGETADERPWLTRLADAHRRLRGAGGPPGAGWAIGLGAIFALIAGVEYASWGWRLAHPVTLRTSQPGDRDPLATMLGDVAKTMPADWDGWKREGADAEHLTFTNAMFSNHWAYRRGGEELNVFLHRRYPEFHGMEFCYSGSGWQLKDLSGGNARDLDIPGAPENLQFMVFEMEKQDEGSYVVAYVNFDYANARWIDIPAMYQGLTLSGKVALGLRERWNALQNIFRRSEQTSDVAVVLVQLRTTRGAEAADRKLAIERLVSASLRTFAPLLSRPAGPQP
jgi:exosortase